MNSVNAISIYIVDGKLIKMRKQLENLNQTNEKTNVTRESYLSTLTLFQDMHTEKNSPSLLLSRYMDKEKLTNNSTKTTHWYTFSYQTTY